MPLSLSLMVPRALATSDFVSFGVAHGLTVLVFLLMVVGVVALGRSRRLSSHWLDTMLAIACASSYGALIGWWLGPATRDLAISLPLHLCDVANLVAVLALTFPWRGFRVLLHFWAFGLTSQAFITPTLASGPGSPYFWVFWGYHFAIVGTAIYDVACRGFRPGWRDCLFAMVATALYLATVFPVNLLTGGNYGYVGPGTPGTATVLDVLGPYPQRVVMISLLGAVAFVFIQGVWTALGWWRSQRRRTPIL
ncbi:MAG: TMEM164-related integral membrane acyltransferase [Phycisphaerales bacterium]